MRIRTRWMAVGVVAMAALVAAGCGDDSSSDSDGPAIKGTVTADGSSTVFPIMQAVAEEFRGENGDVEVSVGTSGTGGGFERFCAGESDISNASRAIKEEEQAACEAKGIEFVELEVAIDGLSVVVNPANDFASCLTLEQLKTVWGPDSTVDNWNQVDDSFPDQELVLYGPGTDSGTFDYFTDEVNGEEGASRSDYTASEDDNVLVQGVAGDEGALGYFGHGYAVENPDKVKAIGVDAGEGCIEPTNETIESGEYAPLSRPLFVYVAREASERAEVEAFVDFLLEEAGTLSTDVGFVALPEVRTTAARAAWNTFLEGDEAADEDADA